MAKNPQNMRVINTIFQIVLLPMKMEKHSLKKLAKFPISKEAAIHYVH